MSNEIPSSGFAFSLLFAVLACACNIQAGSETTSQTGAPAPAAAAAAGTPRVKLAAHAGDIESSGAAPSAEMVAKAGALTARLGNAVAPVPGSRVAFVNCEHAACSARLSATSLESLQASLASVSQDQQGRIGFVARERLDPYQGRSFEADLTLDTDAVRSVPADASALLDEAPAAAPIEAPATAP
jgi:hypothetical protein